MKTNLKTDLQLIREAIANHPKDSKEGPQIEMRRAQPNMVTKELNKFDTVTVSAKIAEGQFQLPYEKRSNAYKRLHVIGSVEDPLNKEGLVVRSGITPENFDTDTLMAELLNRGATLPATELKETKKGKELKELVAERLAKLEALGVETTFIQFGLGQMDEATFEALLLKSQPANPE